MLEEAGYRVLDAATADEALVLFKINQIDTLFTDIDMPGSMDGLGLVKAVRARWPATRIIVTSDAVRLTHRDMESGVFHLHENDGLIATIFRRWILKNPAR